MVNLEKVKQECRIALYDEKEEKKNRDAGRYYRSDFIGKEIIKSIFTGTIAYAVLVALWAMANWEAVLESVNDFTIIHTIYIVLLIFVGFIAVYLLITYVVYAVRYVKTRKKMDRHMGNLKALHQMYQREEKLKL